MLILKAAYCPVLHLLIGPPDGELAGPEELAVWLLALAEPLDRPGERVLHVLADLGPASKWSKGNWSFTVKGN